MADLRSRCICLFSQIFLWSFLLLRTCAGSECKGTFEFPELNTTVWTAKENTTITLNFRLNYSNCELPDNVTIILKKRTKESGRSADFCTIRQRNGLCRIPLVKNGCGCSGLERGVYQLERTVNRSDNAVWIWTSADERVEDKELILNILYPAEVYNLTINGEQHSGNELVARQNDVFDVVCLWENGNPPVSARLLDRHGVEMEGSIYSSGQIRYRFPAVGCQDAGLIRCEAPGASHNGTTTLLVRCPPAFPETNKMDTVIAEEGMVELEFTVRTHSVMIEDCIFTHVSTQSRGFNSSLCKLNGTPPDLTLTVRLDNVRREEEGQWRLELTNDAGTGYFDFFIQVIDRNAYSTQENSISTDNSTTAEGADGASMPRQWTIIASVCVAVVLVIIVIIVIVQRRKRGSGRIMRSPADVYRRSRDRRPESADSQGSHIYSDVVNIPLQEVPENDPDDYLEPVPISSEYYERPSTSHYARPGSVYEPLRNVYQRLRVRARQIFTRD